MGLEGRMTVVFVLLLIAVGSASGAILTNHTCVGAIDITPEGNKTVSASLLLTDLNAMYGEECGPPDEGGVFSGKYSHWFSFHVPQKHLIAVETSSATFDSQLIIWSGQCDALECVTGNDDISFPTQLGAHVEFEALKGVIYYIVVGGYHEHRGNYSLQVSFNPLDPEGSTCAKAWALDAQQGTIKNLTDQYWCEVTGARCGGVTIGPYAQWYTFNQPTTGNIGFSTNYDETQFDTQLFVFTGSCESLVCVTGNDDAFPNRKSFVEFTAQKDTTYYVILNGYWYHHGQYKLGVESDPPFPDGYRCSTAISTTFTTDGVLGNTTDEYYNEMANTRCADVRVGPYGFWYSTTFASSDRVAITTDFPDTNFDTELIVYTGSCGQDTLQCVTANDEEHVGVHYSLVEFEPTPGQTYYILVTGYSYSFGTFRVGLSTAPPQDGTTCETAFSISAETPVYNNLTDVVECSLYGQQCGDVYVGFYSHWYKFDISSESTSYLMGVTTDLNQTQVDTELFVYSGACNNLQCVTGNDDISSKNTNSLVEFDFVPKVQYYAIITGYMKSTGPYGIVATKNPPLRPGTRCSNAFDLGVITATKGAVYKGNTTDESYCELEGTLCDGVRVGAYANWFKFTVDNPMELPLSTDFSDTLADTELFVYTGESCAALQCQQGDWVDPAVSYGSTMTQNCMPGVTYYAVVTGRYWAFGQFHFEIAAPFANSTGTTCASRFTLELGHSNLEHLTDQFPLVDGPVKEGDSCNSIKVGKYGHWYELSIPKDHLNVPLTISTINTDTNFDTLLFVWSSTPDSECNALSCVVADDDIPGSFQSVVEFTPVENTMYYLLVTGYTVRSGQYKVEFATTVTPPQGVTCENPYVLEATEGFSIIGNVSSHYWNPMTWQRCASVFAGAHANWFNISIPGKPTDMSRIGIRTDFPETDFDTELLVYTGTCDALTCETANDDLVPGTMGSYVEFDIMHATTYSIMLTGYSHAVGNYKVAVTLQPLMPNGTTCQTAQSFVHPGTNKGTFDSQFMLDVAGQSCQGLTVGNYGRWFSITFDDQVTHSISTDHVYTNFSTQLFVYSGSCDQLACVAGDKDSGPNGKAEVSYLFQKGIKYYVLLSGVAMDFGSYEVNVLSPGSGSTCALAIPFTSPVQDTIRDDYDVEHHGDKCLDNTIGRYGLWYSLGTWSEDENYVGYTTNFDETTMDTELFVFESANSPGCDTLTCIAGDDDIDPSHNHRSSVFFSAKKDYTYYLVVTGFNAITGNFKLDKVQIVPGSYCANAFPISMESNVTGFVNASTPCDIQGKDCANVSVGYYSKWYTWVAPATELIGLNTNFDYTNFDTMLFLWEGDCKSLTCIDANDDGASHHKSRLESMVHAGNTYHALVTGFLHGSGDFALHLGSSPPRPQGVDCENPISLPVDATQTGLITDEYWCKLAFQSFAQHTVGPYGSFFNSTFTSTDPRAVSVDFPETDFDTQLFVFRDSCSSPTVIASADDQSYTDRRTLIPFYPKVGPVYTFLLTGFGYARGNYKIVNVAAGVDPGDMCQTAIDMGPPSTLNTTVGQLSSTYPECGLHLSMCGGVRVGKYAQWFTFTPTTKSHVQLTTNFSDTAVETELFVYSGSCGEVGNELQCIIGTERISDDNRKSFVEFNAEAGTKYYVLLTGVGSSTGIFRIGFGREKPPAASFCADAQGLPTDTNAVVSGEFECEFAGQACSGVTIGHFAHWYLLQNSVAAPGLSISTIHAATNFTTQLIVYQSSGALADQCSNLKCLTASEGTSSEIGTSLSFDVQADVPYYVVVAGKDFGFGKYEIDRDPFPSPAGSSSSAPSHSIVHHVTHHVGETIAIVILVLAMMSVCCCMPCLIVIAVMCGIGCVGGGGGMSLVGLRKFLIRKTDDVKYMAVGDQMDFVDEDTL